MRHHLERRATSTASSREESRAFLRDFAVIVAGFLAIAGLLRLVVAALSV
jgi:hypothetical protein